MDYYRKQTIINFQTADDNWSDELQRLFGKNAGDVRYTARGEGEPGSELNRLYLEFRRTGGIVRLNAKSD